MKKIISLWIVCLLLFSLTACTGSPSGNSVQESPSAGSSTQSSTSSEMNSEAASTTESHSASSSSVLPEQEPTGNKILIAYFSRTGSTEQIATIIQELTGGELHRIETSEPYPEDYNDVLARASQEQQDNARPDLSATIADMDGYDTVFIGYPIWLSDTPMAVLSFLESYDLSGKTIIPFCTHGGGGSGQSFERVKSAAPGAAVLEGFSITGSSANEAQSPVSDWLDSLNLS